MNLVAFKKLTKKERKAMKKLKAATWLSTANGLIKASWYAMVYVPDLQLTMKIVCVENTPSVVSLGQICTSNGFTYLWEGTKNPVLIHPNGSTLSC